MNKELGCKWFFGPEQPGNVQGPNSATALTFSGEMYHSLIRESIQNSLDAVYDKTQPVRVSFKYGEFYKRDIHDFFELKDHIQGCLERFPVQGKDMFTNMLGFFNNSSQEIGYIRISDSNTIGMHYDEEDEESKFNAFIAEGVTTHAEQGSGGSFGFGKAVFWNLSPINTILVSSKSRPTTEYGEQTVFVGKAKLCSHYSPSGNGDLLVSNGIYSTDGNGKVVTDESLIPDEFKPKDYGTSVFVMGAPYINDEIKKVLVEFVLKNFWMAIYHNKLVVDVERTIIDAESLPNLMSDYFSLENNNCRSISEYNPRIFYNIFVESIKGLQDYEAKEGSVEMDSKDCRVKLYIHKNPDAKGQFVFMRSLMMGVYSENVSGCRGCEGVFLCDDYDGNIFLSKTELSAHDSWTPANYQARGYTPRKVASHALSAIKNFIVDSVKEILLQDAQEVGQIAGLEKVLSISTPKAISDETQKDEIVDPETLVAQDVKKTQPSTQKVSNIRQPKKTKGKHSANGSLLSNHGGKGKRKIPGPIKPGSLGNKSTESKDGHEGIYAVPVKVSYRTWSEVGEDKKVWHVIRVFSEEEIDNAFIQIFGVNEDGSTVGLHIVEAPGYNVRTGEEFADETDFDSLEENSSSTTKQVKNAISGVHISENVPKLIKVRFNSDIKYALRINSDKIVSNEDK